MEGCNLFLINQRIYPLVQDDIKFNRFSHLRPLYVNRFCVNIFPEDINPFRLMIQDKSHTLLISVRTSSSLRNERFLFLKYSIYSKSSISSSRSNIWLYFSISIITETGLLLRYITSGSFRISFFLGFHF